MMDLNSKLEKCMERRENLSSFIQCFPLGIICGRPNSELAEMVQLKIGEKLGTEITVKFLFDKEQNFCEKVETVVNSYEEKIRGGILDRQMEYFIPVLMDEESLEKNTVSKALEKVCQTLRQRGYKWRICYYLIIDRIVSQKEISLEAGLEKLWEKNDYKGSIGVFEPNTIDDHAVRAIHGCKTGEAKITKAYNLPCEYVIHTVGPIWMGGMNREEELLADCYLNSMKLAVEYGIRTIAFPSISTGVYHFPLKRAAEIAVSTVDRFLKENPDSFDMVEWVLFNWHTESIYKDEIEKTIRR